MKSFIFVASAFLAAGAFAQTAENEPQAYGGEDVASTAITTAEGGTPTDIIVDPILPPSEITTAEGAEETETGDAEETDAEMSILPITTGALAPSEGFTMTNEGQAAVPTADGYGDAAQTTEEGAPSTTEGAEAPETTEGADAPETTEGADAPEETDVTETTIDGIVYIPKTLCSDSAGPSETEWSPTSGSGGYTGTGAVELPEPTSVNVPTTYQGEAGLPTYGAPSETEGAEATGDMTTLLPPVTTDMPEGPGDATSLIDPVTTGTDVGAPSETEVSPAEPTDSGLPDSPSEDETGTCHVNLVRYDEKDRYFDVPNDNYVFGIKRHGVRAATMKMDETACAPEMLCQAYKDKNGREPIRTPISPGGEIDVTRERDGAMGQESWVRSVKCWSAGEGEATEDVPTPPTYEGEAGVPEVGGEVTATEETGPSTTATLIEPTTTAMGEPSSTGEAEQPQETVIGTEGSGPIIEQPAATTEEPAGPTNDVQPTDYPTMRRRF